MAQINKMPYYLNSVSASEIVEALYYPRNNVEGGQHSASADPPPTREMLVDDETGKPRRALLAVHAPFECVAHVPTPTLAQGVEGGLDHQLYVGTKEGLKKQGLDNGDNNGKKRSSMPLLSRRSQKFPRTGDKIQVYVMSTFFDEKDHKVKAVGVRLLSDDPTSGQSSVPDDGLVGNGHGGVKRSSSWDVAESLANDEGVSDFFGGGGDEDV